MMQTLSVRVSAGHVNMPLAPCEVFRDSAATAYIEGVPSAKDGVAITGVSLAICNAAGVTLTVAAKKQASGVWTATFPATHFAAAGFTSRGVIVSAGGTDENGEARTWILGVGDIVTIAVDSAAINLGEYVNLRLLASVPTSPVKGDVVKQAGAYRIFNGTSWDSLGGGGGGGVATVNGKEPDAEGNVQLDPADIGALAEDGTAEKALELDSSRRGSMIRFDEDSARWEVFRYGEGHSESNDLAYTSEIPSLVAPSSSATNEQAAQAKAFYEFVNSSINAMAAFYLTADAQGNAFATKAALTSATVFYNGGVARTPTKNDYLIVLADESHTTSLGVNPTTRYVYDGSAWAFQYVVNNNSLTQGQVDAINSGITALLVSWLAAFKGTDTATTLASLVAQISGKLNATNPVLFGHINFDTAVDLLRNASSGSLATQVSGESPRDLAHTDELEYDAANDDTRPEGLAQPRSVSTYKVVAGTPLTITLPSVSASDKSVSNLDLIIDAIGVTTLPAITIQPATGGKAYAVKGTMPEIKEDCITIIDATSVPGKNAWAILGASELKEVTNA